MRKVCGYMWEKLCMNSLQTCARTSTVLANHRQLQHTVCEQPSLIPASFQSFTPTLSTLKTVDSPLENNYLYPFSTRPITTTTN